MLGVWFLATSLGNLIAGLVGGTVNPENLPDTPKLFLLTAGSLIAAGVVLTLLIVPIRNMMAKQERAIT
jgi:POT family proton-dependent oligopeptide transporter